MFMWAQCGAHYKVGAPILLGRTYTCLGMNPHIQMRVTYCLVGPMLHLNGGTNTCVKWFLLHDTTIKMKPTHMRVVMKPTRVYGCCCGLSDSAGYYGFLAA
jgi:hypothetical protein